MSALPIPASIEMPYKGLESLKIRKGGVWDWAYDLNLNTAKGYAYQLLRSSEWAKEKGYWPSAEAMLDEYRNPDQLDTQEARN